MKHEAVSLTLTPDVLRTVTAIAVEESRSRSTVVDRAYREWLAGRTAPTEQQPAGDVLRAAGFGVAAAA
jgi:predicted transcriptional regulator